VSPIVHRTAPQAQEHATDNLGTSVAAERPIGG